MITLVTGDATKPPRPKQVSQDPERYEHINVILHICNNRGVWGAGFVKALSKRFSAPEANYRSMSFPVVTPQCQFVYVDETLDVVNMIAQLMTGNHLVRYSWLDRCLNDVAIHYQNKPVVYHLPRIGVGIGGGVWEDVSWLIDRHLGGSSVLVYDFKETWND